MSPGLSQNMTTPGRSGQDDETNDWNKTLQNNLVQTYLKTIKCVFLRAQKILNYIYHRGNVIILNKIIYNSRFRMIFRDSDL